MRKKMGNILLAFCLFTSIFPGNIQTKAVETSNEENKYGYVDSNIKIFEQPSNTIKATGILPSRFDLREEDGVTSIKNQNPFGTCWAFSSMSSVESNLKYTTGKEVDLSESNLVVDRLGVNGVDNGGNYSMSTSYFANGTGPVLEKDDPYFVSGQTPVDRDVPSYYNVDDSLLLPSRASSLDNDKIKETIMKNGAVGISYYDSSSYLADDKVSYYYNNGSSSNHAVTLVGWDDNYPKEKFKNIPSGNGAFIVKNSWGSNWGDDGYFYISYYDTSLGYGLIFSAKNIDSVNDVDNRYSYGKYSINYTYNSSYLNDQFMANVNTAKNNELLSAFSIFTFSTNAPYEVYIDENYTEANYPNGDISYLLNKKRKSGVLEYAGLNTIKLDTPIEVQGGKRFMVAVKYKDIVSPSLEFTSDAGKDNSFLITYNKLTKKEYANPLTVYSYNKAAEIATSINVDKTSLMLKIGEKSKINASIVGNLYTSQELNWTSSDHKVAVVDEDGVVTGRGNGNTVMTVSNRSGSIKRSINVSINTNLSVVSNFNTINKEEKYISFDDSINAGIDYSKISLKDANGNPLLATTRIDNRRLYIKVNSKYLGNATLSIPKNALVNKVNKGLDSDKNLSISVNTYSDTDIVTVSSKDVSKAIANELGKAENQITSGDLSKVTSLHIYGEDVDFKDIGLLTSLSNLYVTSNGASKNLKDLTYLQNLEYVTLNKVNMINLKYLSNNVELKGLTVNSCNLYTLEGIEKFTKLYNADLGGNYIKDIKGIENLINLRYLELQNNQITDISLVKGCKELTYLSLYNNKITSLNGIESLTNLETINASRNYIKDLNPLEKSVKLYEISLESNEIEDLTPIRNLSDIITSTYPPHFYVGMNHISSDYPIMKYLKDTKGWDAFNDEQRPGFYETKEFQISTNNMNSKNGISLTFNIDISEDVSIRFYRYNNNYDQVDVPYTVSGNKILIDNKLDAEWQENTYSLFCDIQYVDVNGESRSIFRSIDMIKSGFYTEDINKDNVVNITDLAEVAAHYNEKAVGEMESWQYNKDLNLDGAIDIYDLVSIARAI
ncbi:C1 family peptidase [Clostridium sp. HBUAS56017]|uniref:C1 family peptidase n=1 Tax=Clostridium sp. HBUAS56017 TaxID=2571128 RepID=UPI00117809CC|nr:C1 family peptidase [Clostridium sp. HBUAS56017]